MIRSVLLFFFFVFIYLTTIEGQVFLTTITGTGSASSSGDGRSALSASVHNPIGIWSDGHGNVYFGEFSGYKVRKIDSFGIISTLVGTGSSGNSGAGGVATTVSLPSVFGVYGLVSTFAGSGSSGFTGDGGPATSAKLSNPRGLFLSSLGVLYISDCANHRIRYVDSVNGVINTFSGNGTAGFTGDNKPPPLTSLFNPSSVWGNTLGIIFIADFGNRRIRKVDTLGIIVTIAGTGVTSSTGDNGPATLATLNYPIDVKGDNSGNLFITDSNGCRLRRISTSGIITSLTGTGACTSSSTTVQIASSATISNPQGMWVDSNGGIYFSEGEYIRYISDSTGVPSSQPTTSPTTLLSQLSMGLIAYYPFDNSANDVSGNNLHGTVHGPVKVTGDRNGVSNQAYSFDGVSSYVEVSSGNWFNFYQDMSISVWMKQSSVLPSNYGTIVDKTRGVPVLWRSTWTLVRCPSSNSYAYSYADSAGNVAPFDLVPINNNGWVHFTLTKQGQIMKYYVNGVLVQSTQASSNQPAIRGNGNLPLVIGASNLGYTSPASELEMFYNGSLDDLMLYNRTLSAGEVVLLFSSSLPIQPSSQPSIEPSSPPTTQPSSSPSNRPSSQPSTPPSVGPSSRPSNQPTGDPSSRPTNHPSVDPSSRPSNQPTAHPSVDPSSRPSNQPTTPPTNDPSSRPSNQPTGDPSIRPSSHYTTNPSVVPSSSPSRYPIILPSARPSSKPSDKISATPSLLLTVSPTALPRAEPSTMPRSSSPPSSPIFFFSCFTNISSWKASLFLFGIFSNDDQAFKTFNPSPVSDSPSFIIFGSESLMMSSSSQIDVTTCASLSCHYPVAEISASYKRDLTSRAAVIPGDVNGDPYLDLFLCSPLRSSCYIFFGKDDGLRNVMIGVTIYGPLGAFFGFAIAGTDDMNGDGFVDMVVSALTGKACYVIYGRKSWPSEIKVTEMRSGVDGYKIAADSLTTLTGISVAGGGDMNGDGNFDVALSVFRGGVFMVYVVWEGGQDISLIEVGKGIKGFVVVGEQGYYTGLSIAGVGDLNNDGLADLVIGAIPYPDRANRQQKSHVIFGSSGSPANVFLGASTGRNVMTILGGGFLVSGPGDVNDDGISDIMITYVSTFLDGANGYIVSYPSKVSTPPSFSPSSYPSSAPSHHPVAHLALSPLTVHPSVVMKCLLLLLIDHLRLVVQVTSLQTVFPQERPQ